MIVSPAKERPTAAKKARVGKLVEAIWGQPDVLQELEKHPSFPSLRAGEMEKKGRGSGGSQGVSSEDENNDEDDMDEATEQEVSFRRLGCFSDRMTDPV